MDCFVASAPRNDGCDGGMRFCPLGKHDEVVAQRGCTSCTKSAAMGLPSRQFQALPAGPQPRTRRQTVLTKQQMFG
jgi:hypothetical protein